MTCLQCETKYTFNMDCRTCTVRWLRTLPDWYKRNWLKEYRETHGREEMLKLIGEIQDEH